MPKVHCCSPLLLHRQHDANACLASPVAAVKTRSHCRQEDNFLEVEVASRHQSRGDAGAQRRAAVAAGSSRPMRFRFLLLPVGSRLRPSGLHPDRGRILVDGPFLYSIG